MRLLDQIGFNAIGYREILSGDIGAVHLGDVMGYRIYAYEEKLDNVPYGLSWRPIGVNKHRVDLIFKGLNGTPWFDSDFTTKHYVEQPIFWIAILVLLESGLIKAKHLNAYFW